MLIDIGINIDRSRYRKNIQGVFEKDPRAKNSLIEQVKNIAASTKAHNVSVNQESRYTYNGLSSDIQSQFLSTEAGRNDNSLLRNITFDSNDASTPIRTSPRWTRSAVNAGKIFGSRAYSYLELDRKNTARRVVEKEIKEEEEDEWSKKRIDNLFTKLRFDEKSIILAKGDDLNEKNIKRLSRSKCDKDKVLVNL